MSDCADGMGELENRLMFIRVAGVTETIQIRSMSIRVAVGRRGLGLATRITSAVTK
jgi:hypothetical protein